MTSAIRHALPEAGLAEGQLTEGSLDDRRALRTALGCFATGVAIMTTLSPEGRPVGLTANSFASVSLDPPLVLWSLSRTTPSFAGFEAADRFAVNVLTSAQLGLAERFARRGIDKFEGVHWQAGLAGLPLIGGALAQFECRLAARHEGGDHRIYVGEVERFRHGEGSPLLFVGGRWETLPAETAGRTIP